jgi:hypothetical protein
MMTCRLAKSYGLIKLLLCNKNNGRRLRFPPADGFSAFHSCSTTRNRSMSASSSSTNPMSREDATTLLPSVQDKYGGVMTEMTHPMDPSLFSTLLRSSLSTWTLQVLSSFFLLLNLILLDSIKMTNFVIRIKILVPICCYIEESL